MTNFFLQFSKYIMSMKRERTGYSGSQGQIVGREMYKGEGRLRGQEEESMKRR